jgi:hypothetical protein
MVPQFYTCKKCRDDLMVIRIMAVEAASFLRPSTRVDTEAALTSCALDYETSMRCQVRGCGWQGIALLHL